MSNNMSLTYCNISMSFFTPNNYAFINSYLVHKLYYEYFANNKRVIRVNYYFKILQLPKE